MIIIKVFPVFFYYCGPSRLIDLNSTVKNTFKIVIKSIAVASIYLCDIV